MVECETPAQLENLDQQAVRKLYNIIDTKQQMKAAIMRNKEVTDKFYVRPENGKSHYLLTISEAIHHRVRRMTPSQAF